MRGIESGDELSSRGQKRKPWANSCFRAQMLQMDAAQRTLLAREARRAAAAGLGAGTSLTSLHRRRRWALWMPDLERVALAKVMKDCGRITVHGLGGRGCRREASV